MNTYSKDASKLLLKNFDHNNTADVTKRLTSVIYEFFALLFSHDTLIVIDS